jgi:hypothetical protein
MFWWLKLVWGVKNLEKFFKTSLSATDHEVLGMGSFGEYTQLYGK